MTLNHHYIERKHYCHTDAVSIIRLEGEKENFQAAKNEILKTHVGILTEHIFISLLAGGIFGTQI